MKLVINCSTLSASGATQVSVSFIYECINFPENEYFLFLSKTVSQQISAADFPDNFHFYILENHPAYGIKGFKIRKLMRTWMQSIKPDVVFSVFGPSWWTPEVPHLQGYAYSHYIYEDSPLFTKLSPIQKFKINIFKLIHINFLIRNGDHYVSETKDVSNRLKKLINKKGKKYYTVTNTANNFFIEYQNNSYGDNKQLLPERKSGEFRFLSLCTYHVHKNLDILNEVIPILNTTFPDNNIRFVLTIDEENYNDKFSPVSKKSIINLGRVDVQDCPQLYQECDALFLPTLLECFSANYPEAMVMERPILTSNLSFATEVCVDAARYFDPMAPNDIAQNIIELVTNENLRTHLVLAGKKRLKEFDTPRQRAEKYLDICKKISKE